MRPQRWWRDRERTAGVQRELTCREVGRVLQSHLDGELDELARRRVARHLDDCRRCGLEARTYGAIKASLAKAAAELPPEPLERLRAFADELATELPEDEPPGA